MGVRGLLSYVLRHADAMTQRVDLAQEAQYYGRNGPFDRITMICF